MKKKDSRKVESKRAKFEQSVNLLLTRGENHSKLFRWLDQQNLVWMVSFWYNFLATSGTLKARHIHINQFDDPPP
jgi:hypothetical protein